ncbi:unnamed protein product [Caenorhabditis brenneri]
MLHFRKFLLDKFNGARSMLASGQLNPLIDIINKLQVFGELPHFGPAANMHRLKWSRHLEQHAYLYSEEKGFNFTNIVRDFKSDKAEGLVGFYWAGNIINLAQEVLKNIPHQLTQTLYNVLDAIEVLISALLLLWNYPWVIPWEKDKNFGATQALFAHRYEIGCYGKLLYTVCMMENSTNGNRLYETGIPCSNCTEYCEFKELDNGAIEEGNLCEAPKESVSDHIATFSPPITTTVWNRKLELISYQYGHNHGHTLKNDSSVNPPLIQENHVGFYWMGDLSAYVGMVMKFLPSEIKDKAGGIYDFLEGLFTFFMIAISMPMERPLKRGEYYGAAELLYAERFEIGCHSNVIYSICFVEKLEYKEKFFDVGVSCFKCPGRCEFWLTEKGEYEEGDLCVPPQDFYTKQIAEVQTLTDAKGTFSQFISFILIILITVWRQ